MADVLFETSGGRNMGISSGGDPMALRLVVFCHPAPGAAGFDPDPEVTRGWGVRLLSWDRPGYGASDPLSQNEPNTIAARADDIAEFVTQSERSARSSSGTQYGRIGVVGWQFGGLVALELAARHPHLVDGLALVDTPAPHRALPAPEASPFALDSLQLAPDDQGSGSLGLRHRLDRMLDAAGRQGDIGLRTDESSLKADSVAATVSAVAAPTRLLYGDAGPTSATEDGRWYRELLPQAQVARVADSRGLSVVTQWAKILDHVAPNHGE